jgi:hypothetical protein
MGTFLSLTSVVGKTAADVTSSLKKFAQHRGGDLQKENLSTDDDHCCIIAEANGNASIFYPYPFLEWDDVAEFISKDLLAPVFSFHIHDGDFWMYQLFVKGQVVDQFNPMPDYWDENIKEAAMKEWKGNAAIITRYVPYVGPAEIEKYLVYWPMDEDEAWKAYETDEFENEEWQLLDFMKKLQLPYPLDDDGTALGETYQFWTAEFPMGDEEPAPVEYKSTATDTVANKPWWKFW